MDCPGSAAHKRRRSVEAAGSRKRHRGIAAQPLDDVAQHMPVVGANQANMRIPVSKAYVQKASAACDTCRHKKVKCSEDRPACVYCDRHGFHCSYPKQAGANDEIIDMLLIRFFKLEQGLDSLKDELRRREVRRESIAGDPGPAVVPPAAAEESTPRTWKAAPTGPSTERNAVSGNASAIGRARPLEPCPYDLVPTTSFTREGLRPPPPNLVTEEDSTKATDILPYVDDFLQSAHELFPLMCKSTAYAVASLVRQAGIRADLESCYALLMVALSKAYSDPASATSGLHDFQTANQILGSFDAQLSLNHVLVQVLSSLFFLKKGRLENFALALHTGCASLYTLIRRDRASGLERTTSERNTISNTFWICHNLELDLVYEIDETLPQSPLYQLKESFALPLGCDLPPGIQMPPSIRDGVMLFLAGMSLKAVLTRILTTVDWAAADHRRDGPEHQRHEAAADVSPLTLELRNQLDEWLLHLPRCLDWSPEPARGSPAPPASQLATRLKHTYWFARFALARPMILGVLGRPARPLLLQTWALFGEGIVAAHKLVRIFVWEESETDFIMGNRIISAIEVLRLASSSHCVSPLEDECLEDLLVAGTDLLHRKLAGSSELIARKLHNLASAKSARIQ